MGLPYSKQINAAFDQVTPLVAAGFEVLQTTKDIALFLAVLEVIATITLLLVLLALLALLITVNPDLEKERVDLVTPAVKWLAGWVYSYGRLAGWIVRIGFAVGTVAFVWSMWQGLSTGHKSKSEEEEPDDSEEKTDEDASKDSAKDEKDEKDEKKDK